MLNLLFENDGIGIIAESVYQLLYIARLPGDVHVLLVAADAFRPPLAFAFGERHCERSPLGAGQLPGPQRDLLRRRTKAVPVIPPKIGISIHDTWLAT